MPKARSVQSERRVDGGKEEPRLELVGPELTFPRDNAVTVREVCGKIVKPQREADLVEVMVHAKSFGEVVDGIVWAGLARHHIGVGDDERPVSPELGDEPAQPRSSMAQISMVVHHAVRRVRQELHRRFVCAGIVTQPDVVLPDTIEPFEQCEQR